jgi:hypothetical protein
MHCALYPSQADQAHLMPGNWPMCEQQCCKALARIFHATQLYVTKSALIFVSREPVGRRFLDTRGF